MIHIYNIFYHSIVKIFDSLKLDGDTLGTWKKGVTRILKRYIKDGEMPIEDDQCPNCGGKNLVHKEGCVACNDCQWSKCI
jgi:ribonucleoside-diphosphate reductase alpha chain